MKRAWVLIIAGLFTDSSLEAVRNTACGTTETKVIEAQARCMDKGGVSIGENIEGDATYSCLLNKDVQNRCGPDGSLTRLRAYQDWLKKLKEFESTCVTGGGTFAFGDPYFTEPSSESYCRQAEPEITSNMFEDTVCNFKSACPPVKVACEYSCSETPVAALY